MTAHRTVVVGGGLAGLTAAAYLARLGCEPLVLEKSASCGGLVQSFERGGFVFDAGPRALGNSGILLPMLQDLGIELPMIRGLVSMGMGGEMVHFDDPGGAGRYLAALRRLYPGRERTFAALEQGVRTSCAMTRTLGRLPNPYFRPPLSDIPYLLGEFIPWLPSFLSVALRTGCDRRSVEAALAAMGADAALSDLVCGHFFKGTPRRFALGYFENFRDYLYPLGGTGRLAEALGAYIRARGGTIATEREVLSVRPADRVAVDRDGEAYGYRELLWAADLRALYERIEGGGLPSAALRRMGAEKARFRSSSPGESVFTLFLGADLAPEWFGRKSRGHLIYTPRTEGLGDLRRERLAELKAGFGHLSESALREWVGAFCARSAYEISIPALKDATLAPAGKTGLVVSLLTDGGLWETAERAGRAEELKELMTAGMLDALESSIYPGLRSKLLLCMGATPLSLTRRFGTSAGAITGWSLERRPPVPSSLLAIGSAVRTAVPHLWKAGQWSYSPSGVPVAILTGRIAAGGMAAACRRA